MKRLLLVVSVMGLVGAAEPTTEDAAKKELEKLQGTWTMAALEVDGKPVPEEKLKSSTLTIKGEKYIIKVKDDTHETIIKLDPKKKPKEIDMTFTEGANKDKVLKGIYELDGDTFKICRALLPDKDRPTEFGTWPDTGVFLVTWKRQTAKE
ncbi:MAG: TIGR03067 domain-containing protein [Gemmataceae bacterium]